MRCIVGRGTTGYHGEPQDTTGYHGEPQDNTGNHRIPRGTTGYHGEPQGTVTEGRYSPGFESLWQYSSSVMEKSDLEASCHA